MYVLLSSHERFYRKELRDVAPTQLIAQPCNRGTLPAILCSLVSIIRQDKERRGRILPVGSPLRRRR